MSSPDPNPFESPLIPPPPPAPVVGRGKHVAYRLILTAIFGVLGCSSLSLGFVMAISLVKSLAEGHQPGRTWYVSMGIFFWTGVFWILASWLYLHKHRQWGTIAATVGFVLPVGWEVIGRMWK
jgi:hypothetical protein